MRRNLRSVGSMYHKPRKGREVFGREYEEFKHKSKGEKLYYIRTELNKLYPKEYTITELSNTGKISDQGLRNIEGNHKNPNLSTIEILVRHYNVPITLITDKDKIEKLEELHPDGFFLGKEVDMKTFFSEHIISHGVPHFLDPREPNWSYEQRDDGIIGLGEPDYEQYDVIKTEEGHFALDRISIEVTLNVFQTSTGASLWRKVLQPRAVVAAIDVPYIQESINKLINLLEQKQSLQLLQQEQLKRLNYLEALDVIRGEIARREGNNVDKLLEELENALGSQ